MTRTCALYAVPNHPRHKAKRIEPDFETDSPAKARRKRKELCEAGQNVAIHVGNDHPETLPFGERLWLEPGSKAPSKGIRMTQALSPDERHKAFKDDLAKTLERHHGDLPAEHMLAVAAQVVGMLICMQDQNKVTPDQAMDMVMKNIVIGNETAMAEVLSADEGETTMNRPQHVTFTGLDERTDLQRCQELSKRYPIEWGVLVGNKTGEHPRYPGADTLEKIVQRPFQKALHLCGDVAMFFQERPWEYSQAASFDRVQVNRKPSDYNLDKLRSIAPQTPFRIIVQHREAAFPEDEALDYLYDTSGGRGTVPETVPSYSGANMVGYAGGINPGNVEEWLRRIDALVYWIDMESGVRTPEDWLDLDACQSVCETIWGTYGHN